jgi:hypothetical protein
MQLRLPNENGIYTPIDSTSIFSYSNLVRIYRGFRFIANETGLETDEYVPIGTFMVDRPEVFAEKGMSLLTVDGSDLYKKIATGGFASAYAYSAGAYINTVITKIAEDAGVSSNWLTLDPLDNRTADGKRLGASFQWEVGDNRSDMLSSLEDQFGIQIYFDVNGYLVSAELPDPDIAQPVYSLSPGENSILLGITKILSDANLINHIIVRGENVSGKMTGISYEIVDSDPNSPTFTGRIGNRVFLYVGAQITTLEQAQAAAVKLFLEKCLMEETIKIPLMCIPQLEGNDVIEVIEPDLTKTNTKYLCQRFDISLRDARMTIEAKKMRKVS